MIGETIVIHDSTVMDLLTAGLRAESQRQQTIANNIANADTVGYKRNRTLLEGSDDNLGMDGNDWSARGRLAVAGISAAGGSPVLAVQTDFRQGLSTFRHPGQAVRPSVWVCSLMCLLSVGGSRNSSIEKEVPFLSAQYGWLPAVSELGFCSD